MGEPSVTVTKYHGVTVFPGCAATVRPAERAKPDTLALANSRAGD